MFLFHSTGCPTERNQNNGVSNFFLNRWRFTDIESQESSLTKVPKQVKKCKKQFFFISKVAVNSHCVASKMH